MALTIFFSPFVPPSGRSTLSAANLIPDFSDISSTISGTMPENFFSLAS